MMLHKPIVECLYGWGKVMRLYDDHLDVDSTSYALVDFVSARPIYHHIMGIVCVRLELRFKHKRVVLRGIAAIEGAREVVAYLNRYCVTRTITGKQRSISTALFNQSLPVSASGRSWQAEDLCAPLDEHTSRLYSGHTEHAQTTGEYDLGDRVSTTAVAIPRWQMIRQEQRVRKLKRLQAERAKREHGFDVEQLARRLQADLLPQIYVPTRLLAGEYAHYCTDATLCEEPLPGAIKPSYQVRDQGLLILTSWRMIYIGRKRQLVLGYNRLLHVSRLCGAIAVLCETWSKREIFEVRLPLECTMYLDAILLRFRQKEQNTHVNQKQQHVRQLYSTTNVYPYQEQTIAPITQVEIMEHQQPPDPGNG